MQGWLLLAMAIATSTVAQETELEESVAWSFPDAVHAIEALNATMKEEKRWCASHACLQWVACVGWVEAYRAETHRLP